MGEMCGCDRGDLGIDITKVLPVPDDGSLQRVCRGVELDPLYVDVIVRRYEAATGKLAVLIETGEAFELLAPRRASEAVSV
jgi:hypothetical protein